MSSLKWTSIFLVEKDGSRANGFFNEARIDGIETAS
jgi:hypothetical protein